MTNVEALTRDDPRTIGPFTIVGRLGAGGMGAVDRGRRDAEQVAVKVIRAELGADPGFRARFAAEVAAGQRVASFCTAAMLGSGVHEGRPYLITEYIDGPTLLDHVTRRGALSYGTLQGLAVGVAAALTAIHGAGLIHRDLKPSNVILSVSGPRVIDFGIARAMDQTTGFTGTGQLIGSPGWIAPEQLLRDATTTAVDIYTWGCLVAFAARARHPFGTGEPIAMASRILHGEPDLEGVPEPLLSQVRRALDKNPANRPSARDLLLQLVGGAGEARATEVVEQAWSPPTPPAPLVQHGSPPPGPPPEPYQGQAPYQGQPPYPGQPLGQEQPPYQGQPLGQGQAHYQGQPFGQDTRPPPLQAETAPAPQRHAPAARPHRRGPDKVVGGLAATLAGLLLVGGGVYFALKDDDKSVKEKPAADGFKQIELSANTDANRPVKINDLSFTVGHPKCGAKSYAGKVPAKGQFCLVSMVLSYTGDEAGSPRIKRDSQKLVAEDGTLYPAIEFSNGFLNSAPSLEAGGRAAGNLLFDVPENTRFTHFDIADTTKTLRIAL